MSKILLYGYGKSNKSCKKFLHWIIKRHPEQLIKNNMLKNINSVNQIKIFCDNEKIVVYEKLLKGVDAIVVSPGINPKSALLKQAKMRHIKITSELEIASHFLKGAVVGVTGSNGKTTTVTLINKILNFYYKKTFVAGNIGLPLTKVCTKTSQDTITTLELSSFQLNYFAIPLDIAVILNISPDHIKYHGDYSNYIKSKLNIIKNLSPAGYKILNYNDKVLKKLGNSNNTFYFSTMHKVKGAYLKNNYIYFNNGKTNEKIMNIKSIKLLGKKNLENVLASIVVCKLFNVPNYIIEKQINKFKPLKNRLEVINKSGITFINDSKATNIASCIADTNAVEESFLHNNIILLLGGSDKGENFNTLKKLPKLKQIICYGKTGPKIAECLQKGRTKKTYFSNNNLKPKLNNKHFKQNVFKKIEAKQISNIFFSESNIFYTKNLTTKKQNEKYIICNNLKKAVEISKQIAQNGDIVLLAPACASFDEFTSYVERGNAFKNYIQN